MEATQTVLHLKAGHTLTQADVDAILFVGEYERRDQERQVDCFHRGWQMGLLDSAGKTKAGLVEKGAALESQVAVEKALGLFYQGRIKQLAEALKPFAYGWTVGVSASHEAAIKTARAVLGPAVDPLRDESPTPTKGE